MHRRLIIALSLAGFIAATSAGAAEDSHHKKGGGETFIEIRTLTATIIRADGRRGVLTVEVGIDVPDSGLRARADASTPRLQAAYVQVVQTYAAGLTPTSVPNADFLVTALQRQTDLVLGRPGAKLLMGTILVN
jgi:hypothetical protein